MNNRMTEIISSQEALSRLELDLNSFDASLVHSLTASLRNLAERMKKKAGMEESIARFELDAEKDRIYLSLYDEITGEIRLQLTPEQVEQGLKELEETEDNDALLSEFFEAAEGSVEA